MPSDSDEGEDAQDPSANKKPAQKFPFPAEKENECERYHELELEQS